MSGRSARSIRNFSLERSPNLVLPNVGQVDFHDFGNSWKVTSSQIASKMVPGDPQWSLDAPWVLLDPPKMKLEKKQIHKTKSKHLTNLENCKDVRRKIIAICLVITPSIARWNIFLFFGGAPYEFPMNSL